LGADARDRSRALSPVRKIGRVGLEERAMIRSRRTGRKVGIIYETRPTRIQSERACLQDGHVQILLLRPGRIRYICGSDLRLTQESTFQPTMSLLHEFPHVERIHQSMYGYQHVSLFTLRVDTLRHSKFAGNPYWPRGRSDGFCADGGFSIISVSFREREAARNLARAASVLLKSSPKKRIHGDDIPLSLRMSGQFCTNRISTNSELGHHRFFRN